MQPINPKVPFKVAFKVKFNKINNNTEMVKQ